MNLLSAIKSKLPDFKKELSYFPLIRDNFVFFPYLIFFCLQVTVLILYPYSSFHYQFLPLISFTSLLTAFCLSFQVSVFSSDSKIWISLFALFSVFSFQFMSLNAFYSEKTFLFFIALSFFYLSTILLSYQKNKVFFFALLACLAFITSVYGIWQLTGGLSDLHQFYLKFPENLPSEFLEHSLKKELFQGRLQKNAIFSNFTNPNIYGGFLLILMPFLFQAFLIKNGSLLLRVTFLFPLIAFFYTHSRCSLLLWITVPFWFLLIKKPKKYVVFLLLTVSTIFLSPQWLPPFLNKLPNSFLSRLNYWRHAFQIIKDFPLTGTGLSSFPDAFLQKFIFFEEYTRYAHNHFIEMAAERGIPLAICFMLLYLYSFMPLSKKSVPYQTESFSPQSIFSKKSLFLGIISAIILILLLFYFPPFPVSPPQLSFFFSSTLLVCGSVLFILWYQKFDNWFSDSALTISVTLLFLYGMVDFHLENLTLHTLFFIFMGYLITKKNSSSSRFSHWNSLFRVILLIGMLHSISAFFGDYYYYRGLNTLHSFPKKSIKFIKRAQLFKPMDPKIKILIAFTEMQLIMKSSSLPNKTEALSIEINKLQKTISALDRHHYDWWFIFAKFSYQYMEIFPEFSKTAYSAINQALNIAPFHLRLLFWKGKILEKMNKKSEALWIYRSVKTMQKHHGFSYAFRLNLDEENWLNQKLFAGKLDAE